MSKSLCRSVLTGVEESRRIIIHDSIQCNGRPLAKFAVCQLVKRYHEVHIFLYEGDGVQWVKGLPYDVKSRLVVHSCAHALTSMDRPLALMQDHFPATDSTAAVVVDSLSSLLLHCSPPTLTQWMVAQPHLFLALLHSDLHTGDVIAQLDYVTTSKLVVNTSNPHLNAYTGAVYTTHKRPSGKLLKQHEAYHVSLDCSSLETSDAAHSTPAPPTQQVDPAANLTFDLHLSAQEKEARSQVVLPYTSAQQDRDHQTTGSIFYEADEMDFEDSDPDDDLDF